MTRNLFLGCLSVSIVAALSPNANAETVPNSHCMNSKCHTQAQSHGFPCSITSSVCDRDISFSQLSDGVPEPVTGMPWKVRNCPTVDGMPCTENDPGGTAKVSTVVVTATESMTTEVSVTGGPNVDLLMWKAQFEIHIGRSWTETYTREFQDQVTVPHCRVHKGHGDFVKTVDAQVRVNIVHSATHLFSGPPWCAGPTSPRECNRSTATVAYDKDLFGVSLSTDENNSCAYEAQLSGNGQ